MSLYFDWDPTKAAVNIDKHGVSFEEAATAFGDPLSLTISDPDHSSPSDVRFILLGMSRERNLLVVVHAESGDTIRIISARRASRKERRTYETND